MPQFLAAAGTLLAVQLLLFGWVECKRWVDFFKPQSQGEKGSFLGFESVLKGTGQNGYPGGPFFDPFGFAKWVARLKDGPVWTGLYAAGADLLRGLQGQRRGGAQAQCALTPLLLLHLSALSLC